MDVLVLHPRFVVVDKPSGLSVHRGWDAAPDNVLVRLRAQFGRHVYPVHRLDRGTSGALLVALDPEAAGALGALFRDGLVDKEYLALVRGPVAAAGRIEHPIATRPGGARVPAVTDYAPIALVRDRYALVRAWPRTGRAHQLRRHFKHLSRPILGDTTYGDGRENRKLRQEVGLFRLALHALALSFVDPWRAERVEARAPLPADLREPLLRLGFDPATLARAEQERAGGPAAA